MPKRCNIMIMAPSELHWRALAACRAPEGEELRFHPLLRVEDVVAIHAFDAGAILAEARQELDRVEREHGSVDAIIAHWDFPSTLLVPILCRERGLCSPSLEAVVQCNHKYYGRLAQAAAIPELVPRFTLVDPFAPDAAESIELDYPFWIKPVQAAGSHLGFRVEGPADLERALTETRADLDRSAQPWDRLLERSDVAPRFRDVSARRCVAEELVRGIELAHEGHVQGGEITIHGTLDMPREDEHFTRYVWPSSAPAEVLARMEIATGRLLRQIGFEGGCFNAEYFWDPERDELRFIEINPRISQSHSPLCVMVDGSTNHQVAVDVALGRPTLFRPRAGPHRVAAKFMERWESDGVVRRVPRPHELADLAARYPSAWLEVEVREGQRLSELVDQDAYGYVLMDAYVGAASHAELETIHDRLRAELRLEVDPIAEPARAEAPP